MSKTEAGASPEANLESRAVWEAQCRQEIRGALDQGRASHAVWFSVGLLLGNATDFAAVSSGPAAQHARCPYHALWLWNVLQTSAPAARAETVKAYFADPEWSARVYADWRQKFAHAPEDSAALEGWIRYQQQSVDPAFEWYLLGNVAPRVAQGIMQQLETESRHTVLFHTGSAGVPASAAPPVLRDPPETPLPPTARPKLGS